jgi:outer membrane immunogenic protein
MNVGAFAGALLLGVVSFPSFADSDTMAHKTSNGFDWSGAYVGLHLGYGWGGADFEDNEYNGAPPFPEVNWDADDNGFLGGIQAGYNWQRDHIVYGLEAELGFLDLDKKKFPSGVDPILGLPYDAAGTVDGDLYAGLSARLGYAWDRTLFYGKVGAVYSRAELGFLDTCTAAPCGNGAINAKDRVDWGYQIGAGLEHAIADSWTIRAEYAYLDFGNDTISGTGTSGVNAGKRYKIDADLTVQTLKFGLNYKF